MPNAPIALRYSPLGWAQWLYGPFFFLAGIFLLHQWVVGIHQAVANAGGPVTTFGQMITVIICRSLRPCDGFEFWFGATAWSLFALVAVGILLMGILIMSFDRLSTISANRLETRRGRFLGWHREVFDRSRVLGWSVEKVPIVLLLGRRASVAGWRFRIVVMINRVGKKPRTIVVGLFDAETDAQRTMQSIRSAF